MRRVTRHHPSAAAVAATLFGSLAVAQASAAPSDSGSDVAITLPRPTGPCLTGNTRIHLRDEGRVDPFDPQQRRRELMVQLWYPARSAAGTPRPPYPPPGEAAALQAPYPVPAGAHGRDQRDGDGDDQDCKPNPQAATGNAAATTSTAASMTLGAIERAAATRGTTADVAV